MRLKNSLKLFVILLCLSGMNISLAQQKKWTLRECVEYAIENNITVQQFELDLENAMVDKKDAIGNFVPSLNANSSVGFNKGLTIDPTTNNFVTENIVSANASVSSNLTIFDGMRNFNQLNRAKLSSLSARYRLEGMKDDIRLSVSNAYLRVLANRETANTFRAQFRATEQDLKRTKELVENGVLPEGDLLEIESTAATQEQQIINAENNTLIARINLAQLLQITDYENFDVVDEGYIIPESNILNYTPKEIYNKSLGVVNVIKASEVTVELAEKDLSIAKGARYPTLGASMNYNTRYSELNVDESFNTIPFVEQLWLNDGISYGFGLNIPFLNGFGVRNNIERRRIALDRQRLQYESDKLDLETNVNQAYADVKGSYKSYEAATKSVEARRLAYQYAKERYDVGLMNSFEFSQAQARLDNAEAELIRAKYNYIFNLKVLEFYFGVPIDEL
ncbi:TolC family protein [Robertkochia marina]|uniref:TolC family protein n=1 Tax=Robertkochia marina TaxID=1227945 RepID=A0A4S3M3C0_9FLAO|nr:TolC family protein [Robertkochia marina]THD69586.1 TolC family protein [Robertkochia marina]TRZ47159.1 TolC family protein [Robertkochia marina]